MINSLDEDAKVTILATGFDNDEMDDNRENSKNSENDYYDNLIKRLYKQKANTEIKPTDVEKKTTEEIDDNGKNDNDDIPFIINMGDGIGERIEDHPHEDKPEKEDLSIKDNIEPHVDDKQEPQTLTHDEGNAPQGQQQKAEEEGNVETKDDNKTDNEPSKHPEPSHPNVAKPSPHRPLSFVEKAKRIMDKITELTQDPPEN
jgi:cell division protein FtsZ